MNVINTVYTGSIYFCPLAWHHADYQLKKKKQHFNLIISNSVFILLQHFVKILLMASGTVLMTVKSRPWLKKKCASRQPTYCFTRGEQLFLPGPLTALWLVSLFTH